MTMDTGLGNFAQISENMAKLLEEKTLKGHIFKVGEKKKVKECSFRINNIGRHTLTLRLLPDDKYQQIPKD